MATTLKSDNTPYTVNKSRSGGRGIVQAIVQDSNNPVTLYGSLEGTDYSIINTFTASGMIEIALPNYLLIAKNADATSQATATAVTGTTKVIFDETRGKHEV